MAPAAKASGMDKNAPGFEIRAAGGKRGDAAAAAARLGFVMRPIRCGGSSEGIIEAAGPAIIPTPDGAIELAYGIEAGADAFDGPAATEIADADAWEGLTPPPSVGCGLLMRLC
jgi:hypothetical protein